MRFLRVWLILCAALILTFSRPLYADHMTIVTAGSFWRFQDNGLPPSPQWTLIPYDDRDWELGRGKFGYGDGNQTTLLDYGTTTTMVNIANYFRHPFYLDDVGRFSSAELRLVRDDGAVVYVNGVEAWRSNMPTGPITPQTLASRALSSLTDEQGVTTHSLSLSLLHPGLNVVAVEVHQAAATSSDMSFDLEIVGTTASPVTPGQTTFAVLGDFGDASNPADADVANLIKSWSPEFILTAGDNNYPLGSASTIDANIGQFYHDYIFKYHGTYGAGADRIRFLPSIGNHDFYSIPPIAPYLEYFTLPENERYFSYRFGPLEVFAVSSDTAEPDGNSVTSIQGQYFHTRVAKSDAPWKILTMHQPPYCSGGLHGSSPEMRWPYKEWGADVVLAGHDHLYERSAVDGFPYFVNGLGGRSIYALQTQQIPGSVNRTARDYGAQRGLVSDSFLAFEFYFRDGSLFDTMSIFRPRSPWKMDGLPEPELLPFPAGPNSLKLLAKRSGDWLYLATASFSGKENMIFLARNPDSEVLAPYGKTGNVAQWDFVLAKNRETAAHGWIDRTGYPMDDEPGFFSAAQDGEVLEAAINLRNVFGGGVTSVAVAVAAYEPGSGGTLDPTLQFPNGGNADGNIDANEYLQIDLDTITATPSIWRVY